jgi:small subunit ribosomal protein S16
LAVRIRLTRVGATKRPAYRVIAIDKRRSRDGRALEILGYYDPLTEPATLHLEREKIQAWIGKGAQPSETVQKLLRQAESKPAAPADAPKPRRATRAADAKPSKKARAKAAAPAEAPAVTADETPDAAPAEEVALAEEVAPAEEVPADAAPAEAEKAGGDAGSVEAADAEKADA